MNKINYLIPILTIFPATICAAEELSETGEMLDGIAAVVNEGVVLKSQLKQQVNTITTRAAAEKLQLPPNDILEEQVLEQLIDDQAHRIIGEEYSLETGLDEFL